jgi:hypothetical protein
MAVTQSQGKAIKGAMQLNHLGIEARLAFFLVGRTPLRT